MRLLSIIVSVGFLYFGSLRAEESPHESSSTIRPTISQTEIDSLIHAMGASDYYSREKAMADLVKLGGIAAPAVRDAMKHPDAEVRFRARRVYSEITRTMSCDELVLSILNALRKKPLVEDVRDVLDTFRKQLEKEYAATYKGEPLGSFGKKYEAERSKQLAPIIAKIRAKKEQSVQKEYEEYAKVFAEVEKELKSKSLEQMVQRVLTSQELAKKGFIFKRSSLSEHDKLSAKVAHEGQPEQAPGKAGGFYGGYGYGGLYGYGYPSAPPYIAEIESGTTRMLLEYTPPDLFSIRSIAEKSTNRSIPLSFDLKELPGFESAGSGSGKTKQLLLPDGQPVGSQIEPYQGSISFTYQPSKLPNVYALSHADSPSGPVAGWSFTSYAGSVIDYVKKNFKEQCQREDVDLPYTTAMDKKLRPALLLPFKGEQLDLERIDFDSYFRNLEAYH